MARECYYCAKKTTFGKTYTHRGLPKYQGGIGIKTTGKNPRKFKPNIQSVRAMIDGVIKRVKVCTSCLRSGAITRPPLKTRV